MKYQVLARKYRPKTFTSMMGQEHVLKALSNALDSERLHHAYLFTGTRGVGKTTVARVLAKALNCEQGITSSPCGECPSCQEIDEGRFVDLIEVDAASRTKVEDTRELLDNVQYAPTRGRFKIYLIDEVHMLSGHSFNALLKTLEEPPPHVKFLLATTDPQKLPVTILSRCLQFNLKSLSIEQIEQQLKLILNAENIPFEDTILKPLAIAADGSMRDALSLLDQSIAYSDGKPNLADIELMLGSVQKDRIFELLTALANDDGRSLIEQSRILTTQGIDVNTILAELISTMQRIALCQMVPDAIDDSLGDKQAIQQLSENISPEDIQLYYQIALNGRKDLPYSPQPQGGFEMILLRMLAFKPIGGGKVKVIQTSSEKVKTSPKTVNNSAEKSVATQEQSQKKTVENLSSISKPLSGNKLPNNKSPDNHYSAQNINTASNAPSHIDEELPPIDAYGQDSFNGQESINGHESFNNESNIPPYDSYNSFKTSVKEESIIKNSSAQRHLTDNKHQAVVTEEIAVVTEKLKGEPENPPLAEVVPLFKNDKKSNHQEDKVPCQKQDGNELADYWHNLINSSELNGLEQQLAKHSALVNKMEHNGELTLELFLDSAHRHLLNDKISSRLINTLQNLLGCSLKLDIKECQVKPEEQLNTPRRREIHDAEVLQQQAEESIYADPKVQMIVNSFAAKIRKDSIKPI